MSQNVTVLLRHEKKKIKYKKYLRVRFLFGILILGENNTMENLALNLQGKKSTKWWCIHFGNSVMDASAAKKLHYFFKKITPHVVFGHQKVFLDVSRTKWKKSLYSFQLKLAEVAQRLNLSMDRWQWGVGASLAESWIMARWKTLTPELLPLEAIADFMNPLELDRNRRNENHRVKLLRIIGANSLQDVLEIPEDVLLAKCGFWITEFTRQHFSRPEEVREEWLEKTTARSFFQERQSFQLEDWIPESYLEEVA